MELEIKNTELITPAKAHDVNKEVNQRINQKIETQRLITGLDKKELSPYGFMTPSLANNDVLTDAGTYVLNFDGTKRKDNTANTDPVLHLFGGSFEFRFYFVFTNPFITETFIPGYYSLFDSLNGAKVSDLEKYASLSIYSKVGSLRIKANVTGGVDTPIIWAKAFELKGTSGIVSRNIPTYFDANAQNTRTQYVQENQVIAADRILAILTKPEILTINISPIN